MRQPFRKFGRGAGLQGSDMGLKALMRSPDAGGGIFRGGFPTGRRGAASESEKEQAARSGAGLTGVQLYGPAETEPQQSDQIDRTPHRMRAPMQIAQPVQSFDAQGQRRDQPLQQ